jgi:hypothetical protein
MVNIQFNYVVLEAICIIVDKSSLPHSVLDSRILSYSPMDIQDFLFFFLQLNQINKQLEELRKMVVNRCRYML